LKPVSIVKNTKKPLEFSRGSLSSGNWILSCTSFRKGPKWEQPKETPIALQSKFLFCSQEDARIT